MPRSIDDLEDELTQTAAEIEVLEDTLAANKAARFTGLITSGGKLKGQLSAITPRQYRDIVGREPPPALLSKVEGGTTKKIPWHMVLDQIATEYGYKSDEELKAAIEQARDAKNDLDNLKAARRQLVDDIDAKRKAKPTVDTVRLQDEAPVFPEGENVPAVVTEVNGLTLTARRNPSFWQIDDNKKETDPIRVRYSNEKREIVRKLAREHAEKVEKDLSQRKTPKITRRHVRITPRMSRLR